MKELRMVIYYETPRYPKMEIGIPVKVDKAETEYTYVQDYWKQIIADEGVDLPEDAILIRYSVDCRA